MTEAYFPISGLPLSDFLLPPATRNGQALHGCSPCQGIPARFTIETVSVVFYYEFSRQRAGLLIYFFSSEITNAEHMPSGHLIEPTAA